MSKNLNKKNDIEAIIRKAVKEAIEAGRNQAERAVSDAYKATERRLYALPTLIERVEDNQERLLELEREGLPERSRDILRFSRYGVRLSAEEKIEILILDIKAQIAADEHEIEVLQKALEKIEDDPYYLAVSGHYFQGLSDEEIARQIPCDDSTVRRWRGRLVRKVAVCLYGAQAV